jgi:hypothetical protein
LIDQNPPHRLGRGREEMPRRLHLTFFAVQFVSADGRTIVGSEFNAPHGGEAAWIATVISEPSAWILALVGLPLEAGWRQRPERRLF